MSTCVLSAHPAHVRSLGAVPAPAALSGAVTDAFTAAAEPATAVQLPVPAEAPLREQMSALAVPLQQRPHDHVHALDLPSALVALAARRETGARVVVRAQLHPSSQPGTDRWWPLVLRAADGIVAPTAADARAAVAQGADRQRVVVCTDAALVAAQVGAAEAGVPGDQDDVPYVLGLSGAPTEIGVRRELVRLLVQHPRLRLVVASPCDADLGERQQLLTLARQAGVLERVHAVGRLEQAQLVRLVDGARLVVATRSDPTCALAPLVAMHRARAVVSVLSNSAEEVVVDGVTGLLATGPRGEGLADAAGRLVEDGFRCLAWGVAGQDRVSNRYAADRVGRGLVTAHDLAA